MKMRKLFLVLVLAMAASTILLSADTGCMGNDPRFQPPASNDSPSAPSNPGEPGAPSSPGTPSSPGNNTTDEGQSTNNSSNENLNEQIAEAQRALEQAEGKLKELERGNHPDPKHIKKAEEDRKNASETLDKLKAQTAGDPVLLTSGQYFQTETDITLKTLISAVVIERFYVSNGSTGGNALGSKWTSSLETRLIRGVSIGADKDAENKEVILAKAKEIKKEVDNSPANISINLQQRYKEFTKKSRCTYF